MGAWGESLLLRGCPVQQGGVVAAWAPSGEQHCLSGREMVLSVRVGLGVVAVHPAQPVYEWKLGLASVGVALAWSLGAQRCDQRGRVAEVALAWWCELAVG